MRKAVLLFLSILALQGLSFALALPTWMPAWQMAPWIIFALVYLVVIGLSVLLLRTIWKKMILRMDPWPRNLSIGLLSLLLLGWLTFAGVANGFLAAGGIFAPQFVKQYDFPDCETTLYLYDGSFLDPQTDIYRNDGSWPWLKLVRRLPGVLLWEDEPELDGGWVVWPGFRFQLESREFEGGD